MANRNWSSGYSRQDLEAAQERHGFEFPADLFELLLERRPTESLDWRTDHEELERSLAWPLEGILFDIDENDFWLNEWGDKPNSTEERHSIARAAFNAAPTLIPVFSHRYIPEVPAQKGNPVFSVYQTDIIYYGANLTHYFENEFGSWTSKAPKDYRTIPFWSDLALLNCTPPSES